MNASSPSEPGIRSVPQPRLCPPVERVLVLVAIALCASAALAVEDISRDFVQTVAFGGTTFGGASVLRFARHGKVFVAERSGIIKVFDNIDDPTPTIFADLSTNVFSGYDRGLLGFTVHPNFPIVPYVYALYTHDAEIGGTAPLWNDTCPDAFGDGCPVSSRLVRLEADGDVMVGSETVLVENWCQQFTSHSAGDLRFGTDGALYVSHGEGASFQHADYGQFGNPCGDPPQEGGALRAQDLRTPGDPVGLHGAILRVDPLTGDALPDNPLFGGATTDDDRVIAYGLRNPFRFVFRPNTLDLWIGDVGWNTWEELNHIPDPLDEVVENFGWPCYEGPNKQNTYDGLDLPLCESLYSSADVTFPYWAYMHTGSGGHAIAGLAFYAGGAGNYPNRFNGALFLADFNEAHIRVMFPDSAGNPDPATVQIFLAPVNAVDLEIGPNGDLFFINFSRTGPATVRRVTYEPPDRSAYALDNCLSGPGIDPEPDPPQTVAECRRAFDCDDDGDVDLLDVARHQEAIGITGILPEGMINFLDCFAGPGATPDPQLPFLSPASCIEMFDLEGADSDVDLRDYAAYAQQLAIL